MLGRLAFQVRAAVEITRHGAVDVDGRRPALKPLARIAHGRNAMRKIESGESHVILNMEVGVDQAGQERQAPGIHDFRTGRDGDLGTRADGSDRSAGCDGAASSGALREVRV